MRYDAFLRWMQEERERLGKNTPSDATIEGHYKPDLLKIESAEGRDLDLICIEQAGLERLWNKYEYTEDKARADWGILATNGSQNPVNMDMHPALLLSHLPTLRSRIKYYKEFCVAHPPAPIEAE